MPGPRRCCPGARRYSLARPAPGRRLDRRTSIEWVPFVPRPLLGRLLAGKPHDTDDEVTEVEEGDDYLDGINPVYVKRYPKVAWKLIAQVKPTCFVASSGPEIWFILWEAKGAASSWNISVHHAAYDGYELISPSLEGWLTAEVARVEAHART